MIELGGSPLSLNDIEKIVYLNIPVTVQPKAQKKLEDMYRVIEQCADLSKPIYGINTGFGALAERRIGPKDQEALQKNIILSHAVGVGEPLDFFIAKALMLLRLNTLIQGYSGASPTLVKNLQCLLNANCAPLVPKKGSVGASGDLAPLAHVGLLLLGLGEAFINRERVSATSVLSHAGLSVMTLGIRDGLALINGTQAMAAVSAVALKRCNELLALADIAAASSIDALGGHMAAFDERIHAIKPHPGQIRTAKNIRTATAGRTVHQLSINQLTQDPYSLRCVPQVHGASKDVVTYATDVITREINAVTDNPLIFTDSIGWPPEILSGGNFHGQHLALVLDYLAMAVAELANIAERRIELLVNSHHSNGLPPFLIDDSGLNSGYMMLHVTASALVNENKVLCHPASTDSIPTSAGREDHVSMGMTAANKLITIIENTNTVLAIEFMAAHQGLDCRKENGAGHGIKKLNHSFRNIVPFRKQDGLYHEDLSKTLNWLAVQDTKNLLWEILEGVR